MKASIRVRLALYLQERSNFIKAGAIAFGVPFAIAELWIFGRYGGIGWWLLLVALTIPVSWLWAFCMWHVCKADIQKSASKRLQQTNDDRRA
jgi:hypothetical protein